MNQTGRESPAPSSDAGVYSVGFMQGLFERLGDVVSGTNPLGYIYSMASSRYVADLCSAIYVNKSIHKKAGGMHTKQKYVTD